MSELPAVAPDLPSARWRAILRLLRQLPQAGLSRSFGRLADTRIPEALRNPVLGAVANALGIDLGEVELPLEHYSTINQLFVRRLREGARSWPTDPLIAASPVDAIIGQSGSIAEGRIVQAKGRLYTAAELLDDAEHARPFAGGMFVTLYLSPRHYHRIHAPAAGTIPFARHVPGSLLPVNAAAVLHVDRLFARNERLICHIDSVLGRVAVVAVGAYNVGRISAAFDKHWTGQEPEGVTNRRDALAETRIYNPPRPVERGAELMAFHLGSTLVVLFESGRVLLEPVLSVAGSEVRVGQPIARVNPR